MTTEEKTQLINKFSSFQIRGLNSCNRIYYDLYYSGLETFQPDYTTEIDRKLANTIFSRFILCLFSEPAAETMDAENHFFALSELKHKIDKLYSKIKNFVTIDTVPAISKQKMYIKTQVVDKVKYFIYNGFSFFETTKTEFDENKAKFDNIGDNSIRFLPLTEME